MNLRMRSGSLRYRLTAWETPFDQWLRKFAHRGDRVGGDLFSMGFEFFFGKDLCQFGHKPCFGRERNADHGVIEFFQDRFGNLVLTKTGEGFVGDAVDIRHGDKPQECRHAEFFFHLNEFLVPFFSFGEFFEEAFEIGVGETVFAQLDFEVHGLPRIAWVFRACGRIGWLAGPGPTTGRRGR
ncbi:MAG: hypothetical protein KatS3mg105_1221 [Gemmatales bacterium]|nr:MAG: hypothetical protein KatS3mg105_1221 [Gemmatales bacterium]